MQGVNTHSPIIDKLLLITLDKYFIFLLYLIINLNSKCHY